MTIAAFSTAGFSQYIAASSNVTASQKAFQSLQQSLAAGNLGQAQAAFNVYQQLNQSTAQSSTSAAGNSGSTSAATTSSTAAPSQFSKDLTALGTAIGSGNVATAQAALATLQGDLKNSPSQSLTNAESAVAQTVSWVDDLLNIGGSSSASTPSSGSALAYDPESAILDSVFNLKSSSTPTVASVTTAILENAYGGAGTSSSTGKAASASSGNVGNSSSVNAYA